MSARRSALLLVAAKAHSAARRDNNAVHRAADSHIPALTLAAAYAFGKGRKAIDKVALKAATTEKAALSAVDGAPKAVHDAVLKVMPAKLLACLASGAATVKVKALRGAAGDDEEEADPEEADPGADDGGDGEDPIDISFDGASPEAIKWAEEHAAELAVGLSDTTREEIAAAIADALEGGSMADAYEAILKAVGDSDRAEMIARTEVMTAANEGQQMAWDGAVEDGLLSKDTQVEWIATSDCCNDCDDMDGQTRSVDGEYDDQDYADGPPAHPNCRCTEGISG